MVSVKHQLGHGGSLSTGSTHVHLPEELECFKFFCQHGVDNKLVAEA